MDDANIIRLDPNAQVIPVDFDLEKRTSAETRTEYFHFCSLESLYGILSDRAIKFNNIANYSDVAEYERNNVSSEFWGQVFVACLTTKKESKNLWEDFGDNGKGVRINFSFPTIFHKDVFDTSRQVRSFDENGIEREKLGFSTSSIQCPSLTCNPNIFTQPIVDISITDIDYNEAKQDYVIIGEKKALNISTVSTSVPNIFWDEYETRVRGILRSTHEITMSKISSLLIPINIKYISVTFGRKVKESQRNYFSKFLDTLQKQEE